MFSLRRAYVTSLTMPTKFLLAQLGSNKADKLFCAYGFTAGQFKGRSWDISHPALSDKITLSLSWVAFDIYGQLAEKGWPSLMLPKWQLTGTEVLCSPI